MIRRRKSPEASLSRSFAAALTMISGPIPAGSPMVMARWRAIVIRSLQTSDCSRSGGRARAPVARTRQTWKRSRTPSQTPPCIKDRGRPGATWAVASSDCVPSTPHSCLRVSPPATMRVPGGGKLDATLPSISPIRRAAASRDTPAESLGLTRATPVSASRRSIARISSRGRESSAQCTWQAESCAAVAGWSEPNRPSTGFFSLRDVRTL